MKKEESHMYQHGEESHKGDKLPEFRFKLVRCFKSPLDRQIAEAIRIEMRGSVLNRRGEYNRCTLTRLGVDWKWEEERYKKSLEVLERPDENSYDLIDPVDSKRPGDKVKNGGAKRMKLQCDERVWGERVDPQDEQREIFLKSGSERIAKTRQSALTVLSGNEWMAYMLAKEIAWQAVDQAFGMDDVATWQEWSDGVPGVDVENVVDKNPECGTAQPTLGSTALATLNEGGGAVGEDGVGKTKSKNKRGKNKLPGVSASQKSVCEFFKKKDNVIQSLVVCEASTSSKSEGKDRQTVMRGGPTTGGGKGVPKIPKHYEIQGGEGQSSEKLKPSPYYSSPTSKKIIQTSRAVVANTLNTNILGGSNLKGGGGSAEKAPIDAHYWRNKLTKFRNLDQD